MLFISKLILLSLYSFLLVRKYTSLFIYVIYFKMDQTVCLFFPIGKEVHKPIYLCYLFQNGSNCLFILSYWKGSAQAYLFHVICFKMDQSVCLFFPIGKEIHKHIHLCDLIQNGTTLSVYSCPMYRKYTKSK